MRAAALTLLLLVAASCAGRFVRGERRDPCILDANVDEVPFDSTQIANLAGRFRLIMVSDWEDEAGRFTQGILVMQPTDSFRQYGEKAIAATRRNPLWGWLDLRPAHISMAWNAQAGHPDRSSVVFNRAGDFVLGAEVPSDMFGKEPMVTLDASWTKLDVEAVSATGFRGEWKSDFGLLMFVKDGRRLPNPRGHFCAARL